MAGEEKCALDMDVTDIKPRIGSEVKADPQDLTSGRFAADLRALLIERGVLVFRDLAITIDEQRAFTATLGRLHTGDEGEGLQKVTLDPKESPDYAAHFANTFFWHMDGAYNQTVPCFGATMRPARLPPEGGETEFLNTYAAYEGLSDEDKALIDRLRVVHTRNASNSAAYPDASEERAAGWRLPQPALQPLVWAHESGRKSLMLGISASHVDGLHPADSYDLLIRLKAHMAQPQFVYTHAWRMNDLVVWNNTGTMHRVRPFDPDSGRLLNRFTLDGEEPIRAPG
jgi:alpha-ketoglutarate-dependent taurine dioxygenase